LGGFLAWLAEGGAVYVLRDPSMIMSKYKRGRGGNRRRNYCRLDPRKAVLSWDIVE